MEYIKIDKNLIPYEFEISLFGEMFKIKVTHNSIADMIVLGLSKQNTETGMYEEVSAGEPVIYGVPLWQDVFIANKFPFSPITPFDKSGESNAVTYDNISSTVFLYIADLEGEVGE